MIHLAVQETGASNGLNLDLPLNPIGALLREFFLRELIAEAQALLGETKLASDPAKPRP